MNKLPLLLILSTFTISTVYAQKWVEVSKTESMSIMANENSFEETKTTQLAPAVLINYKTSSNPSFVGTAFVTNQDCINKQGLLTLGHFELKNEPLTVNTVVFNKGEFKVLKDTSFNLQSNSGFNPLVAKLCSMIPSMPRLLNLVEQGDKEAQLKLAGLHWMGATYDNVSLDKNEDTAIKLYEKAANQGQSEAQFMLGRIYYNGWAVKQDKPVAVSWYEKAANQGDVEAKAMLAGIYSRGDGVPKNKEKSDSLVADLKASGNLAAISRMENTTFSYWDWLMAFILIGMGLAAIFKNILTVGLTALFEIFD